MKPTRQEAKAAGLTRYFGKVCSKHPELEGERRTANNACVECERARLRRKERTPGHPVQIKYTARRRARLKKKQRTLGHPMQIKRRARRRVWVHARRDAERRVKGSHHHIKHLLGTRIRNALNGTVKSARTQELLGCSIERFRDHIEAQFEPGMSWANAGEWHIDHVRPCASFDLTDPAQQRACFHYSNLQPLFAEDNIRKGAARFRLGPLRRLLSIELTHKNAEVRV